ncbi:HAD-IIIA family hydrolase [Candidatus Woesearchaeota archaeon]|nr:HAD-IIIA family hydrolase [Candidatus Woesearchaeota archaeon]
MVEGASQKAFLFDLDDTLAETTEFVRLATPRVIKAMIEAGLRIDEEHIPIAVDILYGIQKANRESTGNDLDLLCMNYRVPENKRAHIVEAGVNRYRRLREQLFEPRPNAERVFEHLTKKGYCIGIVTNGNPAGQWEKVVTLGFERYFQYCFFASDDPLLMKPSPKLILEALSKLDADPAQSYYVGDRDTDILAGNRAGVTTIRYFSGHHRGTSAVSRMLYEGIPAQEILDGLHDGRQRELTAHKSIYALEDIMELDLG